GSGQGAIALAGTATLAARPGSVPGWTAQPAKRGKDSISIFLTGLGAVSNQPANGAPSPADPLSFTLTKPEVTIGGVPAEVTFSGLAPFLVSVNQINASVPATAPTGDAVAVSVTIGGVAANNVTMAVSQ